MWKWVPKVSAGAIGMVLLLAGLSPFIDVFRYIDFCSRKNQVVIESTTCEGFTQGDDGKDYYNFSINVSFGKDEVNNFDVHTLVFKGDEFIGHIKSNFQGTSSHHDKSHYGKYFEANSNQKLEFSIAHTRGYSWNGHEIFEELYYGNLEDYTFVTNIICVYFYDGTWVGQAGSFSYYYDEKGQIHYNEEE